MAPGDQNNQPNPDNNSQAGMDRDASDSDLSQPSVVGISTHDGSTVDSSIAGSRSTNGARKRLTAHRESLNRIENDLEQGRSMRYDVPDPSRKLTASSCTPRRTAKGEVNYFPDASQSAYGASPEGWIEKQRQSIFETLSQRSCRDWTVTLLPMCRWLRNYQWRDNLLTDALAGLTVGVMIIPQSMSYAKLAGLPVEFGLYSSLVPIYAYAVFGSSRQLAVGPVAIVSLLLNTGLTLILERSGITPANTPDYDAIYASMALQVSFLVGVCNVVMGVLQLGFVTIFLSHAVVSGFTSAAAIIIGLSQIKYIFGYSIPSDKSLHKMVGNIFASIDEFNWRTFLLGSACVASLIGLKKLAQAYPKLKWTRAVGPLAVTVITIALEASIGLEQRGIPVVGAIPRGFPKFSGSLLFPFEQDFGDMSLVVLSIVIVGFMESIAIAKQLANKHNYEVDASLELVGLGMANLASGLFGGYPVTGSFSRSAVNNDAGAQSGISAIITATMVGVVLLFLTPVFELLPLAVLASVVISGVVSLVDYPEAIYLWNVHKFDFGVWCLAFLGTLFLGVELGLGIAVGISLLLVLFESAYPHTAVLGRLPGTHQYRNIKQYRDAERYDGIVMVRIDAPIYFANTQNVREKIKKYHERAEEELEAKRKAAVTSTAVKYIILELSPVSHVDTSALHILQDMCLTYRKNHQIQLCLTNPNPGVMYRLMASGVADEVGRDYIFVSVHDAVSHCLHEMDSIELSKQSQGGIEAILQNVEPSAATSARRLHVVKSENTIQDFAYNHNESEEPEVGLAIEGGENESIVEA
eukprot:Nitzschia sp. Nitz4//scaffold22_size323478//249329//251829//NITZ4_000572-RA/size323478-augustus-gene-0.245-mRNA-1//-1//CDS//3329543130//5382//frame0